MQYASGIVLLFLASGTLKIGPEVIQYHHKWLYYP